jgi:hypothetical protein
MYQEEKSSLKKNPIWIYNNDRVLSDVASSIFNQMSEGTIEYFNIMKNQNVALSLCTRDSI